MNLFIALACLIISIIGASAPVSAQQRRAAAKEPTIRQLDPAVEQTVLRARRSPQDFGESVSALTRMGEFQRVSDLLESVEKRGFNEQQKTVIASKISPAERLRIVAHEDVSPAAIKAIDELFDVLQKSLTAPERLGKAIEALTGKDSDRVLPAMRTLSAGGEASVEALVNAVAATDGASKRDTYLRMMVRIDRASGVDALRQLALYGGPATRAGALAALIRLSPRDLAANHDIFLAVVTALHRHGGPSDAADPALLVAQKAITSRGDALPARDAVVELLRQELKEASRIAGKSVRELGRTATWMVTPARDAVAPARLPGWVLAFRDAADAASRLTAVGDNAPASLVAQLNAFLAYNVASDPDWGDAEQVQAFRTSELLPALAALSGISEPDFILDGLRLASESEDAPAMIGWLRLIPPATDIPAIMWLSGAGRQVSPLVSAVDHPHALVRYQAAAKIAMLRPQRPYAGSERVRDRWRQMSALSNQATAIVLENRPEVIAELETLLNQAGLQPRFVSTVAQLEVEAARGEDLRLILCKREPLDVSAIEMIDIIRRIRVARDVPILIYTDPPHRLAKPEETGVELAAEVADNPDLTAAEIQTLVDEAAEAAVTPDRFGVIGGLDNVRGVVHRDLLYGDLDGDSSVRPAFDLPRYGASRWRDESIRAGLISELVRPRSVAGLYEILRASRRRQHLPPLTPVDRNQFREIALQTLAGKPAPAPEH